ncbi:hypothetical protein HY632_00740 [Candidatus Uhrbacteria bacterium]|nr:hypothetical protein [Candidatus Uhrbacteria bacterium]
MPSGPAVPSTQEVSISDLINVFIRGKWLALLMVGASVCIGGVMSFFLPKQYQTRALLQLATRDGQPIVTSESLIAVFETDAVVREIAESLHTSENEARKRFSIESRGGKDFVEIRGRGTTPEAAKAVVELVDGKVLERLQIAYQPARDFLEKEITTLTDERDSVKSRVARLESTEKSLSEDVKSYRAKLAKYSNAESEAETRLVDTYTRLLADARGQLELIVQQLVDAKRRFATLDEEIQRKRISPVYTLQPPKVEVAAVLPGGPSFIPPRFIQNVIYSLVLGMFLAIVVTLVREYHVVRPRRG